MAPPCLDGGGEPLERRGAIAFYHLAGATAVDHAPLVQPDGFLTDLWHDPEVMSYE